MSAVFLSRGGAGFFGVNFARELFAVEPATEVIVLDKLAHREWTEAIRSGAYRDQG